MARTAPTDYLVIPISLVAQGRVIREGSDGGTHYGELDIAENQNFVHCNGWPQIIDNVFTSTYPLAHNGTTPVMRALWQRAPFVDGADIEVKIRAAMSGTTDTGKVRFEMATGAGPGAGGSSDSSEGATIDVSGTTVTTYTGSWTYDAAETVDTIEMHCWATGATDTLRVYSVEAYVKPITSISAGVSTGGYVPWDTGEFAADEPLSVWHRQTMLDNVEALRKTRMDTITSWSEDLTRASSSLKETTSSTYVVIAEVPFETPDGVTEIRWGLAGYRAVAASAGGVKVEVLGGDEVEVTFGSTWTSPYTAAKYDWNSDGGSLTCNDNQPQVLRVSLKGDGTDKTFLMSCVAWYEDAA
ncbi:hypothetical protein CMI37_09500 [Candidatus Pacearchaeota archaeon]|nr:hypothetical protein [Candidatus Pacearchaeota archaeon]